MTSLREKERQYQWLIILGAEYFFYGIIIINAIGQWIIRLILYFILFFYVYTRMFFDDFLYDASYFFVALGMIAFFYILEFNQRKLLIKVYERQSELQTYKILIDSVIPNPICVLQKKSPENKACRSFEIQYMNEVCKNTFTLQ